MKVNLRAMQIASLVLACGLGLGGAAQAAPGTTTPVVHVNAVVRPDSVQIEARAAGAFEFTTYRPSDNLFVIDFTGLTSGTPSGAQVLKSDLVSSYRVLQYRAGDRAIVRLEILLRTPIEPVVERKGQDVLLISFSGKATTPAPVAAKRAEPASRKPVAVKAEALPIGNAIQDIAIEHSHQQTQVRIEGNGRLTYETMRLMNPDRLVLDFSGARSRVGKKSSLASKLDPVRAVRVGQFKPDLTRVVIELEHGAAYNVNAISKSVVVSFGPMAAKNEPAAVKAEPVRAQEDAGSPPAIAAMAPAPTAPLAPTEKAEKKDAAESAGQTLPLPQNLTQPSAVQASPAPPAAAVVVKAETVAEAAMPLAPAIAIAAKPLAPVAAPAMGLPQEGQKYTGEPVSVNLKDVDLKDFFRLIHEISGLNIVLDPGVRGTVTIVLDDVPWDHALDIVLKNNSLDKQLDGNVLRIATLATLKTEAETSRDLAKAKAEAVPQVTRTKVLSYTKAANVKETLKRFLSSRGEILSDDRSNTLIIRDIPTVMPDIEDLIRQLDRKSQQVEIEARVVSATRTFAREIGTQIGFATSSTGGRSIYGGLVGASGFGSPISRGPGLPLPPLVSSGTTAIPLNTSLGATAPSSGASFTHSSPNFALDFIISAAEKKGVGKLISKPRVITQNNEKATIKQGPKIPIQTVINNTI